MQFSVRSGGWGQGSGPSLDRRLPLSVRESGLTRQASNGATSRTSKASSTNTGGTGIRGGTTSTLSRPPPRSAQHVRMPGLRNSSRAKCSGITPVEHQPSVTIGARNFCMAGARPPRGLLTGRPTDQLTGPPPTGLGGTMVAGGRLE